MIKRLRRIFHPGWYHGKGKKKSFFEGWYYKMVSADGQHSLAVIPGIFQDQDILKSQSFIQCIFSSDQESYYIEYPADLFQARKGKFAIDIGGNRFHNDHLHLNIHKQDLALKGDLTFHHQKPWPVTLYSPGIMGWYAWVPFMECFHGVLSMDHSIQGKLEVNGNIIDLDGGKGYMEKDWGTAFPEAWVWVQSNHFSEDEVSLTASIAIIPWIKKAFPGFIMGILWDGRLYRFATYTGAKIRQMIISDNEVLCTVEDGKHELEIHVIRGQGQPLRAPTQQGMTRQISEMLNGTVHVRLHQKIKTGKTLVYQSTGQHAGLEVEGNIDLLLKMISDED